MKKKGDGETRGRGDAARFNPFVAATARLRVPASFLLLPLVFLLFTSCGTGRGGAVPANATFGKCPVCGMNVRASDDWTAEIYYNDQTKLMFESPGDMLAFYTSPKGHGVDSAHEDRANIEKVVVKDFQSKQPTDARQAKFVFKSKVEGPMGPEFLPFVMREDAKAFAAANGGTLLLLDQVTVEMVREVRK